MYDIVIFFHKKIKAPEPWGIYHVVCLILVVVGVIVICAFGKQLRARSSLAHRLTCGAGIVLVLAELLKQIMYGLHTDGSGAIYWQYPWGIFPFQFCSTTMYACCMLIFVREGSNICGALKSFIATYGAFGGAVIMLHPDAVFSEYLFVNIHTMLWHGLILLTGVLQWAGGAIEYKWSFWLKGTYVFVFLVLIALALNLSLPHLGEEYGFNMFYISPYVPCTILFLTQIWESAPYPVFLLIYVCGFVAISAAIFAALSYSIRLLGVIKYKLQNRKAE